MDRCRCAAIPRTRRLRRTASGFYEPVEQRARRFVGNALTILGQASVALSLPVNLFGVHHDRCGEANGSAVVAVEWLFFGGLAALLVASVVAKAATWAPAAMVALFDLTFLAVIGLDRVPDRGTVVVVFGTHGVCTGIAAWWSWRARGRRRDSRAKASEAARILTAGWAIAALLAVASAPTAEKPGLLSNSTLVSVFIITAISVVTGAGFTKYAEAMTTDLQKPLPVAGGFIGRQRDRIMVVVRTTHRWFTAYNEYV